MLIVQIWFLWKESLGYGSDRVVSSYSALTKQFPSAPYCQATGLPSKSREAFHLAFFFLCYFCYCPFLLSFPPIVEAQSFGEVCNHLFPFNTWYGHQGWHSVLTEQPWGWRACTSPETLEKCISGQLTPKFHTPQPACKWSSKWCFNPALTLRLASLSKGVHVLATTSWKKQSPSKEIKA